MIRKETAEPVVQYLRTLTYSGELSSDEVWELANWLNQQSAETLESWPAKPLAEALRAAFADSELTAVELEELANTILAIEQLWTETFPPTVETAASDEVAARSARVTEAKPTTPAIAVSAEVPDEARADSFTVDLQHHTCTCPEWTENRADFPEGDYRRCCVHLMHAFRSICNEQKLDCDPLFMAFIEEHGRRGRGAEIDTMWHVVVINGVRVLYGASPASEWINVFAPDEEGVYKRFGYNRKKKRWAYGTGPAGVSWQIASLFSQTQPQISAARSVGTPAAVL